MEKGQGASLKWDVDTASRHVLLLDEDKTSKWVEKKQEYPDNPERFSDCRAQVLSKEPLTGRCHWEWEWTGKGVIVGVAFGDIYKNGEIVDSDKAWSLWYEDDKRYAFWHNSVSFQPYVPPSAISKVRVDVDRAAGTVSFSSVSSDTLIHLNTFFIPRNEELLYAVAGFRPESSSSASLM